MVSEKGGSKARRSEDSATDDDDDDLDASVLALHRLDTAPRTSTTRAQLEQYAADAQRQRKIDSTRAYPNDDFDDGDDEEAFLRDADLEAIAAVRAQRAVEQAPVMDKTGRPEWLKESIRAAHLSKRVRILLIFGVVIVLAGVFSFAFGNSSDLHGTDDDSRLNRVYKWAGQVWHGNGKDGAPHPFPTNVGYPGPTQTGKAPDMADEDRYAAEPTRGSAPVQTNVPELKDFKPFEHMGNMSPYHSSPGFGIDMQKYRALPQECRVDRVHVLHRHGARYPTSESPANLIRKLMHDTKSTLEFSGPLSFLSHYDADRLGLELLVPLGRQQLFDSGVQHSMQYGKLIEDDVKQHDRLFVRAGSQQRIVDSAIAFLQGAFANQWSNNTDLEVQIEAPSFNTTLAPNFACPRAGRADTEPGIRWGKEWNAKYLDGAVKRLAPHAKGVTLDAQLLNAMQQLCSYDTVAFGRSDFCRLFTMQEWLDYEYYWDLVFYGSYGDGSPVGKAMGVGWVNELMSRLTQTAWDATTQTSENRTLNDNPRTFPVDRRFYADFTHDSTIAGVVAALNLRDFNTPLALDKPDAKRAYRTSTIVPYAARLVFEEVSCSSGAAAKRRLRRRGSGTAPETYAEQLAKDGRTHYVRLLINEAAVDLPRQLDGCSTMRADGMCVRDEFVAAMAKRNEWAHWERCLD